MLCPLRKTKEWKATNWNTFYQTAVVTNAEETEFFESCVKEKCMAYNKRTAKCDLCKV